MVNLCICIQKTELDYSLLKKCDELLIFPKFLNFKVSNVHLKNSPSYDACRRILLAEEIKIKSTMISSLKEDLLLLKDELQAKINFLDYTHVVSCISQINDKYTDSHQKVQNEKLHSLIKSSRTFQNDPDKVIHNFSNYVLSSNEKAVLVKGLNYSVNPGKLNYGDFPI